MTSSKELIAQTQKFSTKNYAPLDVVLARGEGAWVWDVEGEKYLDMLAAYSAINFGHCNDRFKRRAMAQLEEITMVSRAFYNDQLGPFCQELAELCRLETVLPMNSGAEAIESAIKIARRWGYSEKKVAADQAKIICFGGNFAGRTTTIISFSSEPAYKEGFGPFTPGFVVVPYGDSKAVENAIDKNTVAVLLEPIQGEGGIIIPPDGFLKKIRELCSANNVLMIADEIQTGLCRTGKLFACDYENVIPDMLVLGKSLGGGITPISAVIGRDAVMRVLTPGSHGSTFGGNTFACAIAREVIAYIKEEKPEQRSAELGAYLLKELKKIESKKIKEIRGRGLMVGIDVRPEFGKAKTFSHKLKELGVLSKDTREQTLRLTPPLVIDKEDLDWGIERIKQVFG